MKRFLREPLLHFVLLGALVFAASHFTSRREAGAAGTIVVTRSRIEALAVGFGRTWQRPPTEAELSGLIDDYVREEASVREAIALGLDQEDAIVRRRLRQKLEFVSEEVAALAEPTEEQLRVYLTSHAAGFRSEPRLTFRQVYLDPQRRGGALSRDAAHVLADLRRAGGAADVSALGDPLLLGHELDAVPVGEVAKQFGAEFAAALSDLPIGEWQGPIPSGYGSHLVLVRERSAGRLPAFEDVRDEVRREWMNARRGEAEESFYRALIGRYAVKVEEAPPTPGSDGERVAARR